MLSFKFSSPHQHNALLYSTDVHVHVRQTRAEPTARLAVCCASILSAGSLQAFCTASQTVAVVRREYASCLTLICRMSWNICTRRS